MLHTLISQVDQLYNAVCAYACVPCYATCSPLTDDQLSIVVIHNGSVERTIYGAVPQIDKYRNGVLRVRKQSRACTCGPLVRSKTHTHTCIRTGTIVFARPTEPVQLLCVSTIHTSQYTVPLTCRLGQNPVFRLRIHVFLKTLACITHTRSSMHACTRYFGYACTLRLRIVVLEMKQLYALQIFSFVSNNRSSFTPNFNAHTCPLPLSHTHTHTHTRTHTHTHCRPVPR